MAQNYQVTPPSEGQQPFSESISQLAASYGLGSLQAQYTDRKVGIRMLVVGLVFLFLTFIYAVVELPQLFHSSPGSLVGAFIVLIILLLFSLLFIAIGVNSLPVATYAFSEGFLKVRGRQNPRVLQAVRWDQIQEVQLMRQDRRFPYVRDARGTRYIVRDEIWFRAGSELAHRQFAALAPTLQASFHAGQPVNLAHLLVSQSGITLPKGKASTGRVLPFHEISTVNYAIYHNRSNRMGGRRALLSFTMQSPVKIPPIDVVSAVDAALLLLFLQTVSQGQIRCVYGGRTI